MARPLRIELAGGFCVTSRGDRREIGPAVETEAVATLAPDIREDSLESENAPPQASGLNSAPSEDPPAPEPSPATVNAPPKKSPVTVKPSSRNESRKRIRILIRGIPSSWSSGSTGGIEIMVEIYGS
jgi:hypothetical protein